MSKFSATSNRLSLTGSTGSAGARLASVEELDVADDCDADEGIDEGMEVTNVKITKPVIHKLAKLTSG